jgi:hypothetical protein
MATKLTANPIIQKRFRATPRFLRDSSLGEDWPIILDADGVIFRKGAIRCLRYPVVIVVPVTVK